MKYLRTLFNVRAREQGLSAESLAVQCVEILQNHYIPYFVDDNTTGSGNIIFFERPPAPVLAELYLAFGPEFFTSAWPNDIRIPLIKRHDENISTD